MSTDTHKESSRQNQLIGPIRDYSELRHTNSLLVRSRKYFSETAAKMATLTTESAFSQLLPADLCLKEFVKPQKLPMSTAEPINLLIK